MTDIVNTTIQHTGWSGSTFATGGWNDELPHLANGLVATSFYVEPLNRIPTDVAIGTGGSLTGPIENIWFNQHINGPRQGTIPGGQLVTASTLVRAFTRVTKPSDVIQVRFVCSDQVVTPPPTSPPCQYGTRVKPSEPGNVVLTPTLLDLIVAGVNSSWLAPLFVPLHYTVLNTTQLCSGPPLPMPAIDPDDIGSVLGNASAALNAVAWPYFCECVPGTPAPIDYPLPVPVQPSEWPATPTFPCDPANLCATVSAIWREVAGLRSTVGSMYELVTLEQRYGLPFAYIPGALHFGLEGEGGFAIPRSVGVHAVISSPPPALILDSNPDYWWDQGWMSIGNESGMLEQRRVARQSQLWFPQQIAQATRFNFSLRPGVTLDVRELYAEP